VSRKGSGALSVAQSIRKKNRYRFLTTAGLSTGVLSVLFIVLSNLLSKELLADSDTIKYLFYSGIALGPLSCIIYLFAQIAAIDVGRSNWHYVLGLLASLQAMISLVFARDILLIDASSRLSPQTPQWSSLVLWIMLGFSLICTLIFALFSRKKI